MQIDTEEHHTQVGEQYESWPLHDDLKLVIQKLHVG